MLSVGGCQKCVGNYYIMLYFYLCNIITRVYLKMFQNILILNG